MRKSLKMVTCFIMCITFFLLPFSSIRVYADTTITDGEFWYYYWAEEKTGVDWSKYTGYDAGITTANYIYNQTQNTIDSAIDATCSAVHGDYNTFWDTSTNYIENTVERTRQYAKEMYNNTPGVPGVVQDYVTEKALRVDNEGNVNVSGDSFWSSVYNQLFNNDGYKVQYEETTDGGYTVNFNDISVIVVNINYGDRTANWVKDGGTNQVVNFCMKNPSSYSLTYHETQNIDDIVPLISLTLQTRQGTVTIYYPETWLHSECVQFYNHGGMVIRDVVWSGAHNQLTVYFGSADGYTISYSDYFTFKSGFVYENTEQNTGGSVAQPSQVGFIKYGNDKVPVYTDTTQNPFTVNPNGTVTIDDNGTPVTLPVWIDTGEVTPEGDYLILQYIVNQNYPNGTNGNGEPYNLDNLGDNPSLVNTMIAGFKDLLNKVNPFGDLLENLMKALKNFGKMLLNTLFGFNPNDFNVDIGFNFGVLGQLWNAFLQNFGLSGG